ncbi:MAG: FadR/GntR family transcriptional regulator [Methyloligellaceae bacterium]
MFKQVERTPRYRMVAEQIADLIVSGKLERGGKMPPDRELVEKLGVSRATIREAMIALEISGFVENKFGAGSYVSETPPISSKLNVATTPGPFELLEARMTIEGEIASIAAQQITDEDIKRLEYCIGCMSDEKAEEFWGGNADEEFHIIIANATNNTSFVNIVREFWRQRTQMPMWVQMHGRVNVDTMRGLLIEEHQVIVEALKARNSIEAGNAMRSHISSFGRSLLEKWNTLDENTRTEISPPEERLMSRLG